MHAEIRQHKTVPPFERSRLGAIPYAFAYADASTFVTTLQNHINADDLRAILASEVLRSKIKAMCPEVKSENRAVVHEWFGIDCAQ